MHDVVIAHQSPIVMLMICYQVKEMRAERLKREAKQRKERKEKEEQQQEQAVRRKQQHDAQVRMAQLSCVSVDRRATDGRQKRKERRGSGKKEADGR